MLGNDPRLGRGRLHDFARARQVNGTFGIAAGELERARHQLLHSGGDAHFALVAHISAHDAALIVDILNPLNKLVAAAFEFAFLRERRRAGENKNRDSALGGIVNRAGQRLGAALHMHQHRLRASGGRRKSMRGAHAHHFIRAGDDARDGAAGRARGRDGFHDRRVIAAEIGEYKFDAEILQRVEQR